MKALFAVAGLLFVAVVGLFIVGISSAQAGALLFSATCGMYLFVAALSAALTRLFSQYRLAPREYYDVSASANGGPQRQRQKTSLLN